MKWLSDLLEENYPEIGMVLCVAVAMLLIAFVATPKQAVDPLPPIPPVDTTVGAWNHPDAATLASWSDAAGVPVIYTFSIAWEETQNNTSPGTRGKHGEWGRFQIMPATAKDRCPTLDTRTYYGNLVCFLKMSAEDGRRCRNDFRCVARIHNGSGSKAEAYADRVAATMRTLVERETQ